MKKLNLKAFTLVEMLIVIVIIGILIAALLPRMQAAQGRARDVSRKTALSQIQSAIVTHQGDFGSWPGSEAATSGIMISSIEPDLINAGMTDVPRDPLQDSSFKGLGSGSGSTDGSYLYMVSTRNGTPKGGFILMAKTEVPGSSNRVVCSDNGSGHIKAGDDIGRIHPCKSVSEQGKGEAVGLSGCVNPNNGSACSYSELSQLRYIVLY